MEPLPAALLEATEASKLERTFGKIPILGWAIAAFMEQTRFQPIQDEYTRVLASRRQEDVLTLWEDESRPIAERLIVILGEEFGWKPPYFMPNDPFSVAFWAHEDGLDDISAIERVEAEWGIELTEDDIEDSFRGDLHRFVRLIKKKSEQGGDGDAEEAV